MISLTTTRQLAERYDTLLFDAYGVLVQEHGGLSHARELIETLESEGKSYFIVTNDASRSIPSRADRFVQQGVPVPEERIINSGCLIAPYIHDNGLTRCPAVVFGSPDGTEYVKQCGAEVLPHERIADAELFVLADVSGFEWERSMNSLISTLFQRVSSGDRIRLLLPNPDIVYPSGQTGFAFAAAGLALLIESALERLFGEREDLKFVRLGKPYSPIFEEAERRAGTRDMVMIGDQLETDIAGANNFGIDSAVVTGGINRFNSIDDLSSLPPAIRPTYLLRSIKWS